MALLKEALKNEGVAEDIFLYHCTVAVCYTVMDQFVISSWKSFSRPDESSTETVETLTVMTFVVAVIIIN